MDQGILRPIPYLSFYAGENQLKSFCHPLNFFEQDGLLCIWALIMIRLYSILEL